MKCYLSILSIVPLLIFGYNSSMEGRFERLKSCFPFQKQKIEIIEKRWVLPADATIILKNNRGSIDVSISPHQTVVSLTIEKRAQNKEQMDALGIKIDKTDTQLSVTNIDDEN